MNFEHFIAKRISFSKNNNFTGVIVKIAILAVALSLAIMIITSAVIHGFKKEISDKVIAFWGDIHIDDINITRSFEQVPIDNASELMDSIMNIKSIQYEDNRKILGIPLEGQRVMKETNGGVKSVQGTIVAPGLLRTKEYFNGVLLKGVGEEFDWNRLEKFLIDGDIISFPEDEPSNDIIVSKVIADKLNISLGQGLIVSFIKNKQHIKRRFNVKGIYNTGLEEYDAKFALVDIREVRSLLNWENDQVGNIEIVLEDSEDINIISEYIYYDILPSNLFASPIQEKHSNIFEWLKLQDINENLIFVLMVIVGVINMITVLLILILERSKMVGVLKALGSGNWSIQKIFLYNAAYIISFGLILGNVIALSFCYLQEKYSFIHLDEKNYYLSVAPIDINILELLLINLGSFIVILIVMTLPVLLVSWIKPIRVLRFD